MTALGGHDNNRNFLFCSIFMHLNIQNMVLKHPYFIYADENASYQLGL